MAGEGTKRIIDLTEAAETQSGDYIAIDSTGRGTRKLPAGFMATAEDLSEEQTARQTADATLDGKITAEAQARLDADNALGDQITALDEKTEADAALIQNPTKTLSGALVSFTDGADMPMVACTASIVPQQSGTGTPSPDNVRPISGWESVVTSVSGKNVYSGESNIIIDRPLERGITLYTQVFDGTFTNATLYAKTPTNDWVGIDSFSQFKHTLTINRDDILEIKISNSAYRDLNNAGAHLMVSFTDFDTYEPYTGTTTTTSLGRTVYGGTLDVVSGVLTVDRAGVDMGTLSWANYKSGGFRATLAGAIGSTGAIDDPALVTSMYRTYGFSTTLTNGMASMAGGSLYCVNSDYTTDATEFKNGMSGQTAVYRLQNPATYTLTPTEVKTLLGENNVWADSGDVEITYRRDISIVLENLENALSGSNSLNTMMMSAPTENTAEEPTEDEAEDDMR